MKTKHLLTTIFLFVTVWATAQVPKYATAKIVESAIKNMSNIILVDENGETEFIRLQDYKTMQATSAILEVSIENQKAITLFLNDMAEQGYEIIKMTYTGQSATVAFIVFEKIRDN